MNGRPSALIFKQLSFLTKNSFIGAGASYILTLALAQHLGPADFGLYSHILIVGSFSGVIVNFATDNTAPVLFAGDRDEVHLINAVYSVRLFFFAIFLIGVVLFYYSEPITALGIVATTIAALNFGFLYEVAVKNIHYSYIYLCERLLYVMAVFSLMYLGIANIPTVFASLLFFTLASCVLQFYMNRNIAKKFQFIESQNLIRIIKSNSFIVLTALSTFVYGGFSRLVLEKNLGSVELGVYSAGWQIIAAVTIFQAQVYRIWRIKLSHALVAFEINTLRTHVINYLLFSTLPVSILGVLVCYFTPELVRYVFSTEYSRLLDLIPIFCFYFPIISLDGLASILWIAIGSRAEYLSISIFVSIFLLFSLSIFSANLGLLGIAIMVIATHGLSVFILLLRFYKRHVVPNLKV